jgi:apolipoprotein N-acyltransferase
MSTITTTMKFIISFLLTALLAFAFSLFLPWWSIAIAAFLVAALIPQRPGKAFLTGFAALFVFWGLLSFWISSKNEHLLAHKVSQLILNMDNPVMLVLATALIGALVAGFAALAGSYLRRSKA